MATPSDQENICASNPIARSLSNPELLVIKSEGTVFGRSSNTVTQIPRDMLISRDTLIPRDTIYVNEMAGKTWSSYLTASAESSC